MVECHLVPSYIACEDILGAEGLEGDHRAVITLEGNSVDLTPSAWSIHYGLTSNSPKSVVSLLIGKVMFLGKGFLDKSDLTPIVKETLSNVLIGDVDILETHQ